MALVGYILGAHSWELHNGPAGASRSAPWGIFRLSAIGELPLLIPRFVSLTIDGVQDGRKRNTKSGWSR
jgi:hypothetical protein